MLGQEILKDIPLQALGVPVRAVMPGFQSRYEPITNNGANVDFTLKGVDADLKQIQKDLPGFGKRAATVDTYLGGTAPSTAVSSQAISTASWMNRAAQSANNIPGVQRVMDTHQKYIPVASRLRQRMDPREAAYRRRKMQLEQIKAKPTQRVDMADLPVSQAVMQVARSGNFNELRRAGATAGAPEPLRAKVQQVFNARRAPSAGATLRARGLEPPNLMIRRKKLQEFNAA